MGVLVSSLSRAESKDIKNVEGGTTEFYPSLMSSFHCFPPNKTRYSWRLEVLVLNTVRHHPRDFEFQENHRASWQLQILLMEKVTEMWFDCMTM